MVEDELVTDDFTFLNHIFKATSSLQTSYRMNSHLEVISYLKTASWILNASEVEFKFETSGCNKITTTP